MITSNDTIKCNFQVTRLFIGLIILISFQSVSQAQLCVSACFAGVDKCWDVNGPDDKWSNPNNWCPIGVPTTGEWADLPAGSIVTYDYTGPDIINRLDIQSDAQLTIDAGFSLIIENDPACTFCSMIVNFGTVTNRGNIQLSNGQAHGMLTRGTFDNYGSIIIDGTDLKLAGFSGIRNQGIFNNHPSASLEIMNAQGFGFWNSFVSMPVVFTNFSDATISIHDVQDVGMFFDSSTFFENKSGGIIDISNISNPSDKVDIQLGAEVLWHPSVDVR